MIISRKRFQEEIAKAIQKEDEKRWVHQRISEAESSAHRRMDRIDDRLATIERILNQPMIANDAVTVAPIGTIGTKCSI